MRFSSVCLAAFAALSVFFLFFESVSALWNSAVIADVTTHVPPPHKKKFTASCPLPAAQCTTMAITNLQSDGGYTPYANNTLVVTSPLGFKGFLLYASIPDGKHVGTFTVQQGNAQYFDSATPPGSTLQHVNNKTQSQLIAQWTAPPVYSIANGQSAITFHMQVLAPSGTGYIITLGPFQQTNQKFSTPAPTTPKPTTTVATTAAATTPAATTTAAAAVTPVVNCFIQVPANPLTYAGLATPYLLSTDNTGNTPCTMANTGSQAFVQGAIINLDNGKIYVYNPLVIDINTQPAAPIVPPILQPVNNVIATWFGFNGNSLTLVNTPGTTSVTDGNCVNGIAGSVFTQFAYCNAPNFFNAVQNAIENGQIATTTNANNGYVTPTIIVPNPGVSAVDNLACPTLRSFFMVDMDQSDNLDVTYLLTSTNLVAQNNSANLLKFANMNTVAINPGDNALLVDFIAPALKCQGNVFLAPDLANAYNPVPALPLSEIQAALYQGFPQARIPNTDPMVLDGNGNPNIQKLNNFRLGVFQYPVSILGQAEPSCYCKNMVMVAPARLQNTATTLANFGSFVQGQNLFQFLVTRFTMAIGAGGLNCAQFGIPTCFTVTNPNFMPTKKDGKFHMFSADSGVEEEFNVWHRIPGTNNLRMHVMNANGAITTINTDQNVLNSYASIQFSQPENMDHDLGVGIDINTFADPNVANLVTDPGTQNANANQPSSSSSSFLSTSTGLAVIIGGSAVAVIILVAIAASCVMRNKKRQSANTVQMVGRLQV